MLVSAHAAYEAGKRHLRVSFGGADWAHTTYVRMVARWARSNKRQVPHLALSWGTAGFGGPKDGSVRLVRVFLPVDGNAKLFWRPRGELHEREGPIAHPYGDWNAFLTVCRFVAAGKAPKEAIGGWLEDNAPEPYSLLAGPSPVECIRQLVSPLTLLEKS